MRREKLRKLAAIPPNPRESLGRVIAERLVCLRLMCGKKFLQFRRPEEVIDVPNLRCPGCKNTRLKCVESFDADIEVNASTKVFRYRRILTKYVYGSWQYAPFELAPSEKT